MTTPLSNPDLDARVADLATGFAIGDLDEAKHQEPGEQHCREQQEIGQGRREPRRPQIRHRRLERIEDAPGPRIGGAIAAHTRAGTEAAASSA